VSGSEAEEKKSKGRSGKGKGKSRASARPHARSVSLGSPEAESSDSELEVEEAKPPTVPAGPPRRSSRFESKTATVKTEPVDDMPVPHSPGSHSDHFPLFLSGMDPEIEEISQKDYNAGELLTLLISIPTQFGLASRKRSRSSSPSLDTWEECCKRARSASFGSTHSKSSSIIDFPFQVTLIL
jgi:hypothetical protein